MILNLIRKYPWQIGSGLVIFMLLVHAVVVTNQRDAARAARDAAKDRLAHMSYMTKRQNEAIRSLEEAAKQNREVYLAGIEAANKRAVRLEIKAEDILSMPSPTNPTEQCEAARALLVSN